MINIFKVKKLMDEYKKTRNAVPLVDEIEKHFDKEEVAEIVIDLNVELTKRGYLVFPIPK